MIDIQNKITTQRIKWLFDLIKLDSKDFTKVVANKVMGKFNAGYEGLDIFKADITEMNPKVGYFTWNSFLFPGHFSVQAFFLTEIGPVPWNRVNELLSCSLLFHPFHFLCKREINY